MKQWPSSDMTAIWTLRRRALVPQLAAATDSAPTSRPIPKQHDAQARRDPNTTYRPKPSDCTAARCLMPQSAVQDQIIMLHPGLDVLLLPNAQRLCCARCYCPKPKCRRCSPKSDALSSHPDAQPPGDARYLMPTLLPEAHYRRRRPISDVHICHPLSNDYTASDTWYIHCRPKLKDHDAWPMPDAHTATCRLTPTLSPHAQWQAHTKWLYFSLMPN